MRVGLIADIQGNGLALEAALAGLRQAGVDRIVCLGDTATGPEPVRVLDLLREHDCLTVRGNMDVAVLAAQPPAIQNPDDQRFAGIDAWCLSQLADAGRAYVAGFDEQVTLDIGPDIRLLAVHGSPRAIDDPLDSTTPDEDLAAMLAGCDAQIVATGHMHRPMLRRFGDVLLVNPGSVGLPGGGKSIMPLRAEYAVIVCDTNGTTVSFYSTRYNSEALTRRIVNSGMPHAAWYRSLWQE
jgi:putative phosphoesterase